ncbi:hypothetical protein GOBAR_AA23830 [Gossypium barbadense]|uniref:Uncharacterized protein n=1 Tax=Gossypium barbadense TaxID=3634 RepID=A0A2P5X0H2_GOSBA|nr:hypothetical protein GOBAR_AA23830 [Gossypium barbadense]
MDAILQSENSRIHPVRILVQVWQSIPLAPQDIEELCHIDFKPYLPVEEAKGRKPHIRRPRRMPRHPRSSAAFKAGLSSTLTQELTSMATLPPGFVFGPFSSTYYMLVQLAFQMTMMLMTMYRPSMFGALIESVIIMPLMYRTQYEDTRWKLRSDRSQSTMDDGEEDERPRPQLVLKCRRSDKGKETSILRLCALIEGYVREVPHPETINFP